MIVDVVTLLSGMTTSDALVNVVTGEIGWGAIAVTSRVQL